jgi:transcriptional regulator with XRE-family HTH domain
MTKQDFRRLRKSIGYSQVRLAKEMGVFVRTVSRWETGEVTMPKIAELALKYIVNKVNGRGEKK